MKSVAIQAGSSCFDRSIVNLGFNPWWSAKLVGVAQPAVAEHLKLAVYNAAMSEAWQWCIGAPSSR